MKRHHSNSYKEKCLIRAGLRVCRCSSLSVWQEARTVGSRVLRRRQSWWRQQEEGSLVLAWEFESPKATPRDTLPPRRPHLLIPVKSHHPVGLSAQISEPLALLFKAPHTLSRTSCFLGPDFSFHSALFLLLISLLHTKGGVGLLTSAHFTVL